MNNKTQIKDYIRTIENNNGIVTTNLSEIANELNNFFSSVFTIEDKNLPEFPKQCDVLCPNPTFEIETVSKKLATLNVYKSTGVDTIHPRVLKECCKSISKPLSIICDRSFSSGIVPCLWLCANIAPLFKKRDKLKVTNCRPLSLTSIVCKVMESIIRDTLMNHLTKNSILSDSQHGFSSSKSCCINLLETFDIIIQALEENLSVDIRFLDFAKAFDSVAHKRLLLKLQSYGIQEQLLYDTKIISVINTVEDSRTLQQDLCKLFEWSEKCTFDMIQQNALVMEETTLESDLVVMISNDVKWEKHINTIAAKANRKLGQINKSFLRLDKISMKHLDTSLVRPHLEFAVPV
ncbi:uncharacterized protein LOC124818180 [Hydra vulgaris]|uniref:uncharacterized protein LOC124818180 n=1 Tax=Hydra vulgaris TaxID=6087 RepID=UPI001F5FDC53|nr:uncharacterized protein LOC124818180 [Hydra vulgaris]